MRRQLQRSRWRRQRVPRAVLGLANLQRYCDPVRLSAVVLTHEHTDHFSDIENLVTAARWVLDFGRDPIPVFAPEGIKEKLHQEIDGIFDWREVGEGEAVSVGDLQIGFSRTDHPPVTHAVRIAGAGKALGYSADSGPGWPLAALGRDLDFALCEATYTSDFEGTAGHMTGRDAGRTAKEASVRRLVVTHRWPTIGADAIESEAAEAFGRPVEQAAVGRGYSI
jgi:ribonuclease BN (tRNA processing enzyme)